MMNSENMNSSDEVSQSVERIRDLINVVRGDIPVNDFYFILLLFVVYNYEYDDFLNSNIINVDNDNFHQELIKVLRKSEVIEAVSVFENTISNIAPFKLKIILEGVFDINFNSAVFDAVLNIMTNAQGKISGEFMQPKEISRFVISLSGFSKLVNKWPIVYNPFAGLCSYGAFLPKESVYYAQELNKKSWAIGLLRMWLFRGELNNVFLEQDDSVKNLLIGAEYDEEKFDLLVATPPFNLKINSFGNTKRRESVEQFLIENGLNSLKENGKLICVTPVGFLFKGGSDKELRKNLIDTGVLETVIQLPSNLFINTVIPVCVLVLNKSNANNGYVKIVDGSSFYSLNKKNKKNERTLDDKGLTKLINSNIENDFQLLVSKEEIEKNDYNLSVNRYFIEDLGLEDIETSKLETLGNLIKVVKREKVIEKTGKVIKIGDLSKDKIDYTKTFKELENRNLGNSLNLLKQDSLLLSMVQVDLKPTAFVKTEGEIYYPPNFIMACLVDPEKINLDYLVLELHKEYVQNQLKSKRMGTAIQRVSRKDLLEIKIVLPNLLEQVDKVNIYRSSILNKKQEDFKELVKSYGIDVADENSFLRHQIAGSLKNVRGTFSAIKQIINEQIVPKLPEALDLKRNPKLETTLFDYLNILERDITNINKSVNVVGQEIDLTELTVSKFNILDFLTNYVNEVKNRGSNLFTISLDIDEDLLIEKQVKGIFVNGDKEFLRRVFNNIIENAEKHGFNNTINPENKIEIDIQYDFDDLEIQVDFGNTGNPLPENYSHEAFIRNGSKTGANAGNGVGGWFMNEVMKLHNGKFGFTDETGPEGLFGEMITTIELTFPIELKL